MWFWDTVVVDHLMEGYDAAVALVGRQSSAGRPSSDASLKVRAPSETHFGALVRAVVYQQLAGPAAAAIHGRLIAALGDEAAATDDNTAAAEAYRMAHELTACAGDARAAAALVPRMVAVAHLLARLARDTGAAVPCATPDPLVIEQADDALRVG